jgi:hypothetical protein
MIERDEADSGQFPPMLRNCQSDYTLANDRIFRMSYIVRPTIAHVKSQWQEWTFFQQFDKFFGFHWIGSSATLCILLGIELRKDSESYRAS